ncbi:MAG: hypothetical protein HF300_13175 [Ignavibacteria bacterium]|jgi:hypothetical protein|nr:hypothetical protein [Ignavibacteria bacterium]
MIRLLIILLPLLFFTGDCTTEVNRRELNAPPAQVNSLKLAGNYKELVIVVSFPDRDNSYPRIKSNDQFPLLGSFPDGRLLNDYVKSKGGSISADEWHKPALNHYFNSHSGGMYKVDFNFLKQKDGKAYTTKSPLASWIKKHKEADDVIWVFWNEMASEAAEKIYAENPNIFKGVQAIHMVFTGINKNEFNTQHGGTVSWDVKLKNKKGMVLYDGPISIQRDLGSIAHERMHIIGRLHGSPKGFTGFPDRGYDVEAGEGHYNILWGYDMMYHNASIPSQHSLYGLPPILSHDLIYLGWIKPEEIIVINKNNYKNYDEIKLSDVNYPLTSQQITGGYRRIAKVMIRENFMGGKDEYFLIEFHNATEFDKNFANYDEYPKEGYNKGILIWHIKETKDNVNVFGDNLIDLEAAVPYNGFNGDPVPDDNYPRDDYKRPKNWNGMMGDDFDYLDDGKQKNIGGNHWVYEYLPDGGRSEWEVSTKGMTWGWYPKDPSRFPRLQSMRSDFFTDEKIKGHRSDEFTDDTRPSTKSWGGYYGGNKDESPQKTGISVTDIKRHGSYMTLKITY